LLYPSAASGRDGNASWLIAISAGLQILRSSMEKKELDSMSKLRGLFFSLGLVAMTGLMAGDVRAETLTLSVYAGLDTTVAPIYSVTGTNATGVTAAVGTLNTDLAGAGYSAYSFTNLGGSSDNPGSMSTGAYILTTGILTVTSGGSGASTPITVVLTEGGFTLPPNSSSLSDTATSNVGGASDSSQISTGMFTDNAGTTTTTPTGMLGTSGGTETTTTPLATYVTPFTLTSVTTLSLDPSSSSLPGSNGFSQKVFTGAGTAVPEPASLVMMLTGMPLPLVLLGLLRRRAAA
jgi:hypothetical protein